MRLNYYWREALAGLKRAKLMTFLSVSSITSALFILGSFLLVTLNFQRAIDQVKGKFEIQAFLRDNVANSQALVIGSRIRDIPGIQETEYISKQEALKQFRQELADKADLLNAIETNPLPQSFKVKLKAEHRNPESITQIAEKIKQLSGVEEVEYGKAWLGRLYRMVRLLIVIDFSLMVIVSLAAVMVVFNTIQLTLYARRQAIEIMKLVGADGAHIRRPFLLEGMLQGLAGSLTGLALLYLAYRLLSSYFDMFGFFTGQQLLGLLAFGVCLGGLGSLIAVQKFLFRTVQPGNS
ncbi:MAG: permease-like cell division protein FtsX [Candidatus Edwardsbacteria bacterium]|nr:permease-like cell division protein FtsX [Candidatus Edwardsbacteria bacterium]